MFERPGFGSVSFRDSIQTASLFSYEHIHDGIKEGDLDTSLEENNAYDSALKLVRYFKLQFS